MSRYGIIQTIKSAIDGLDVMVRDEPRVIKTTDTLIDPMNEREFPMFCVVPGPETALLGLYGYAPLDCTFRLDLYGYTDGGSQSEVEIDRKSRLTKVAEDIVRAIKKKLTDPLFIDEVACEFSIIQIGPYIVEFAELEHYLAYVSIPLTIQYLDDIQNDTDE
jgi:hypothetical protein